ncbi:DUF4406 domain-containing protein [Pseudomonas sp. AU12215]|uniref:DUF4406 domain-containing protein n=1 Tax=Pseudomonas sp. AU12215 TaxID=1860123 RepID=UPI0007EE6022|nr:DUF4406 domain-containing protein [Pseudomonas sp. AU12215]OBY57752.1 hypothetical protein A9513_005885 [Pseudomonas sp. AU12215]
MKRIYLAGPMTGLPDFNYPAFHAEAARLRQLGYHVENPAENPAPACGTWAGYMRLALVQLVTCDSIALLPGWIHSKGARLEFTVAKNLGMRAIDASQITEPARAAA